MNDQTVRLWWRFKTSPTTKAYVPAASEAEARAALARSCYPGAPVASWPLLGSVEYSREALCHILRFIP